MGFEKKTIKIFWEEVGSIGLIINYFLESSEILGHFLKPRLLLPFKFISTDLNIAKIDCIVYGTPSNIINMSKKLV